jgi:hypothetical protein
MSQYKINITKVAPAWEKYNYYNNTPNTVTLISGVDQDTPLFTLAPNSSRLGSPSAKHVVIDMAIVDHTNQHFYFAPVQ